VSEGGLGLFRLSDFIASLQCSWIKRCYNNINDNWKYKVTLLADGTVFNVVNDTVTTNAVGVALSNIINSFCQFKEEYTKIGDNYLTVPFYCNRAFGYGRGNVYHLDDEFFNIATESPLRNNLLRITWSDISNNSVLHPKRLVEQTINAVLSDEKYNQMKNTFKSAVSKYGGGGGKCVTLREFFMSFKKGSRYFRKFFNRNDPKGKISSSVNCKTFLRLIDCTSPGDIRLRYLYSSWNKFYYNSHIRVFLFKYYNNLLGLNSRVSHFNRDINASCTFCSITGPNPVPAETFSHLFFFCPTVNGLLTAIVNKYLRNRELTAQQYFLSSISLNEQDNNLHALFFDLVRYLVWQAKLFKKIPTISHLLIELEYHLSIILGTNRKVRELINNCNLFQNGGQRAANGRDVHP
jgi:hypothetical protein